MNLVICTTPLQLVIVEKILSKYFKKEEFIILFLGSDSKKNNYYFKRVSNLAKYSYRIYNSTCNRSNFLAYICEYYGMLFRLKFKFFRFNRVFISSIDNFDIQGILSNIIYNEIYTFDDGTINISKSSIFYSNDNFSFYEKILRKLQLVNITKDDIKSLIIKHYTIFKDASNIVDNVELLELFSFNNIKTNGEYNNSSIFIGQNIFDYEPNDNKSIKIISDIIKKYNIEYYLPHPKDKYKIENVKYIYTDNIFEDFYAENLNGSNCKLYTFFSSAVLNVSSNTSNIICIKPTGLKYKPYLDCYNIFKSRGIKVEEYNDDSEA